MSTTVMSYNLDRTIGSYDLNKDDYKQPNPQSYMLYDINALQYMYGANFNYNNSNNVYSWDVITYEDNRLPTIKYTVDNIEQKNDSDNIFYKTIWDGGGNDTYDLSKSNESVKINLLAGARSIISKKAVAVVFNPLKHNNNNSSLIENAITGSGNDVVIGNEISNYICTNTGNDRVFGNDGDDLIATGDNHDYIDGGKGIDIINAGSGNDIIKGGTGNDLIISSEGNDIILFSKGDGKDIILDYTNSDAEKDTIQLDDSFNIEEYANIKEKISSFGPGSIIKFDNENIIIIPFTNPSQLDEENFSW